MRNPDSGQTNLSGHLLVAHPNLLDPNFRHSVVLLSSHDAEDGAMGVVLNRPTEHTLGSITPEFVDTPLARIPIYHGGPVSSENLILIALKFRSETELRMMIGLTQEQAEEMIELEPEVDIRGFLGYSGWSRGQLEGELKEDAWVVSPLMSPLLKRENEGYLWQALLAHTRPEFAYLINEPEDPSVN